ncbi:MAG: class I SAM-dependent methyltransferase, partial [Chloroflexales bacterium]|nr:class I SAM-dependent methyltransferase [Chloroflexales bacterium]
ASVAIYTKPILALYDIAVLGLSNRYAWRCPSAAIRRWYTAHITANHLDIGVGTGYFLPHCSYPVPRPWLTLLDRNPNSLQRAAKRLAQHHPNTLLADALQPLPFRAQSFDSIGLNYVLHCLPGAMATKTGMFAQLASLLRPGGRLFGATILGQGVQQNRLARTLLHVYNTCGVFNNRADSLADLEQGLRQHFSSYTLHVVGMAALFAGCSAPSPHN